MKFKSLMFTNVSGSIGGTTFARNKGGLYCRARAVPTDPATSYQSAVRALVGELSNLWSSTLTAAQRAAWGVYADNVPIKDTLGDYRTIPPLAHYIRSNVPRLQAGATRIDDGPTTFNVGAFGSVSFGFDATADEIDVTFTDTDDWVDEDDAHMIVYASRPVAASINFFKGPFRLAGTIDGDSVTPPTTPAAIALPFPCVAGQQLFGRVQVSRADGRLSYPFRDGAVAA